MSARMSDLEAALSTHLRQLSLPEPEREYRFDTLRKWRFDMAYPDRRIAIECEGGTFQNGRHTRGAGYHKDLEKYNAATEQGWRVFRYDALLINSGAAVMQLERVLR